MAKITRLHMTRKMGQTVAFPVFGVTVQIISAQKLQGDSLGICRLEIQREKSAMLWTVEVGTELDIHLDNLTVAWILVTEVRPREGWVRLEVIAPESVKILRGEQLKEGVLP